MISYKSWNMWHRTHCIATNNIFYDICCCRACISHRNDYIYHGLLECISMLNGGQLLMFHRNLLPPSSGQNNIQHWEKQSCCEEGQIKAGAKRKSRGESTEGHRLILCCSHWFAINSGTCPPFKSAFAQHYLLSALKMGQKIPLKRCT
jgi:hypothetical protein